MRRCSSCHRLSLAAGLACAQEGWNAPTDIGRVVNPFVHRLSLGRTGGMVFSGEKRRVTKAGLGYRQSQPHYRWAPRYRRVLSRTEGPSLDQLVAPAQSGGQFGAPADPGARLGASLQNSPTTLQRGWPRQRTVRRRQIRRRQTCGQNEKFPHRPSHGAGS